MPSYEELKDEFEYLYVPVDFTEAERERAQNQYLDDNLFERKTADHDARMYKKALLNMLHTYIEKYTKINVLFEYADITGLNLVEFLTKYENMMQARHEEGPNSDQPRKPYNGLGKTIYNDIKKDLEVYNKPLVDIWSDQIVNGKLSFEEIREVVDSDIEDINQYFRDIKENPERAQGEAYSKAKGFANIEMAQKALDKAWKDRGVAWRIFHPVQAITQYLYKRSLANTVKSMKEKGMSADGILEEREEITESMMKFVYEDSDRSAKKLNFLSNTVQTEKKTELEAEPIPQKNNLSIPDLAEDLNSGNKSPKIDDTKHEPPSLNQSK